MSGNDTGQITAATAGLEVVAAAARAGEDFGGVEALGGRGRANAEGQQVQLVVGWERGWGEGGEE